MDVHLICLTLFPWHDTVMENTILCECVKNGVHTKITLLLYDEILIKKCLNVSLKRATAISSFIN